MIRHILSVWTLRYIVHQIVSANDSHDTLPWSCFHACFPTDLFSLPYSWVNIRIIPAAEDVIMYMVLGSAGLGGDYPVFKHKEMKAVIAVANHCRFDIRLQLSIHDTAMDTYSGDFNPDSPEIR